MQKPVRAAAKDPFGSETQRVFFQVKSDWSVASIPTQKLQSHPVFRSRFFEENRRKTCPQAFTDRKDRSIGLRKTNWPFLRASTIIFQSRQVFPVASDRSNACCNGDETSGLGLDVIVFRQKFENFYGVFIPLDLRFSRRSDLDTALDPGRQFGADQDAGFLVPVEALEP